MLYKAEIVPGINARIDPLGQSADGSAEDRPKKSKGGGKNRNISAVCVKGFISSWGKMIKLNFEIIKLCVYFLVFFLCIQKFRH